MSARRSRIAREAARSRRCSTCRTPLVNKDGYGLVCDQCGIAAKVEASSLGTPEAKALRATVSDEHAARIVARSKELEAER